MRLSDADLRAELESDPAGLGYKLDGKFRSAAEIGHLMLAGSPSRFSELGGGPLCLIAIGKIVYGGDWMDVMLANGETTPAHIEAKVKR